MNATNLDRGKRTKQAEFQIGFIWVALAAATLAGFSIGAHLASVTGFGFPLGKGFYSFVQTHGHVQLIGWTGLFIVGVSLHFIPRLAGVPIAKPRWILGILSLLATGLLIRCIGHSFVPYLTESIFFVSVNWIVAGSGLIEWCGTFIYLSLLIGTISRIGNSNKKPGLLSVRPYFGMMVAGWIIYMTLNLILLVQMAIRMNVVMDQAWNEFAINTFIGLVLLPVAFAFSVRMFPLYLRLPAPTWPVHRTAYVYLLSFGLQVIPTAPPFLTLTSHIPIYLSGIGMALKGGFILWFVWKLDILTRFQNPWTVNRILHPGPERRLTRPGLPDYGEFGRFELLVYTAYAWLVLGAAFELVLGVSSLLEFPFPISTDAVRHTYLLGFITHLIFGMSVRMIPGFIKKKKIASARLVSATFWLGNAAAVFRVLPLILPVAVFKLIPASMPAAKLAFGLSGIVGLMAVLCLTLNIWKTVRQEK